MRKTALVQSIHDRFGARDGQEGINLASLAQEYIAAMDDRISDEDIPDSAQYVAAMSCGIAAENFARTREAVRICKVLVAKRLNIQEYTVAVDHIRTAGVKLIAHGVDRNVAELQQSAILCGYPEDMVLCLSIGNDGNTKDQMFRTNEEFSLPTGIIFVSSAYHIPRLERTAKRHLDSHITATVASVPLRACWFPDARIVGGTITQEGKTVEDLNGEVGRIFEYTAKGDL